MKLEEMGKNELRAACKVHGVKNYGKMNNDAMRAAIQAALLEKELAHADTAEAEQLTEVPVANMADEFQAQEEAALAATAKQDAEAAKQAIPKGTGVKIEKNRETRNGVTRPSAGGMCREVWDYLDEQYRVTGTLPAAKAVRELASTKGWNVNNANIEFYRWRKFNGFTGRQ